MEELVSNPGEQTTITELVSEMAKMTEEPYSAVYLKKKLLSALVESVTVSNVDGRPNVVTFSHTVAQILQSFLR